ncbi:MAG: hypothetical protein ACKV2T_10545 [Kofleriaceae bacterium]
MTVTLTAEDRARFDALVARDLKPYTLVAKDEHFTISEVEQAILPRERILCVVFLARSQKKTSYVVAGTGEWILLTGHVDHFNAIAERSALTASSLDEARAIARLADTWTTTWEHGQLEIASFAEIPWRSYLEDRDHKTIEAARVNVGPRIGPEEQVHENGEYVFTTWVIAHAKLLRRTLGVTESGRFRRGDEIVVPLVPVPLGRYWTRVDGRLIPTG